MMRVQDPTNVEGSSESGNDESTRSYQCRNIPTVSPAYKGFR